MIGNYITSFIGFLPADHPEVIVYVAIDNAKGITQYGGTVAAPIARNILMDAITALKIKQRQANGEKNYKAGEKKYKIVNDVTGMNVEEARKNLKDFNLEFSGSGTIIKYQSPEPNTKILEGETVRLYLTE